MLGKYFLLLSPLFWCVKVFLRTRAYLIWLKLKNKKEEFGEGDGQQSKAELAAKDDRCQEAQDERNKNSEKEDQLDEPPEFDEGVRSIFPFIIF